MQITNIMPLGNLSYMSGQHINMFLTHLALKYPFYKNFAKQMSQKGYTILDNSLIENNGIALSLDDVLDVADEISAHEIILPDVFLDSEKTIESVRESIEKIHQRYGDDIPFNLMAVAHGKTYDEVNHIINNVYAKIPEISTIGIPKVLAKYSPKGRPGFEGTWANCNKTIHLLGLWYSFSELKHYKFPASIRSVDTCQMAYIAKHHLNADDTRPDGYTVDLENDVISMEAIEYARKACNKYLPQFSIY